MYKNAYRLKKPLRRENQKLSVFLGIINIFCLDDTRRFFGIKINRKGVRGCRYTEMSYTTGASKA